MSEGLVACSVANVLHVQCWDCRTDRLGWNSMAEQRGRLRGSFSRSLHWVWDFEAERSPDCFGLKNERFGNVGGLLGCPVRTGRIPVLTKVCTLGGRGGGRMSQTVERL